MASRKVGGVVLRWMGVVGFVVSAAFVGMACGSSGDADPEDGAKDTTKEDAGQRDAGNGDDGDGDDDFHPPDPADASPGVKATPVDVVFTADNAYKFGWGTKTSVAKLQGSPSNPNATQIFDCPVGLGPEAYEVAAADAPIDGYLYVIAWDDRSNTQGALGQFKRRETDKVVYSGDRDWEVCATGLPYDASSPTAEGPPIDVVNRELQRCNEGSGDKAKTSAGWVNADGAITPGAVGKLTIGEDNSKGYEDGVFPITCQKDETGRGISPEARWMWYSADGKPHFQNDFDPRAFLIFRLPNSSVPPPPVN